MTTASPPYTDSASAGRTLAHIGREELLQVEKALSREWLLTNGLGGYASLTSVMCPTRRYHGLLVVPPRGTVKPHVFLSRFEESLHGGGKEFPLSMARYPDLWVPHGYQSIESFDLVPYPSFRYQIGGAEVLREILLVRGRNVVLLRYRVSGQGSDVEGRFRPLLAFREADALTFENLALDPRVRRGPKSVSFKPYPSLPELHLSWDLARARFEADPVWYRNLEYPTDLARGYDGHEDQFNPGVLHVDMPDGMSVYLAASLVGHVADPKQLWEEESTRQREKMPESLPSLQGRLQIAAEDFLYEGKGSRPGIIAGWHWFQEWGRDTFISLPGLTLARNDLSSCERIFEGAIPYLRKGLLPNIFGASKEDSQYGSADASLWFARAARLYETAGGREDFVMHRLLPALSEIGEAYRDGTDLGIHCDGDGLIHAGGPELNATWMDARTLEGPVTPRGGCPVEINALWYFLLRYLQMLHERKGDRRRAETWMRLKRRSGKAFLERFWIDEKRYLGDCWSDGFLDTTVRPNMVIAAALEFSPLTRGKRTDIVKRAEVELLTPMGLRTLSPKNPAYKGRYIGDSEERDAAYHQGTVWPWLLGFFCEAFIRAFGPKKRTRKFLMGTLESLLEHMETYGLNHVSEVFDGDPPHRPGGTIAQAWNVAELLRAYCLLKDPRP